MVFDPLLVFILVSFIIYIWCFLEKDAGDNFEKKHPKIANIINIGALLCLFFTLASGPDVLLFFVPKDWGYINNNDKFIQYREEIIFYLSFPISALIAYVFEKYKKLRREYKTELVKRSSNIFTDIIELLNTKIKEAESEEIIEPLKEIIDDIEFWQLCNKKES